MTSKVYWKPVDTEVVKLGWILLQLMILKSFDVALGDH